VDAAQAAKRACFFWLMGLIFSIAIVAVSIHETAKAEAEIKKNLKEMTDPSQIAAEKEKFKAINKRKVENVLNLIKNLGDMVTAT
jgi:hypothetical protein